MTGTSATAAAIRMRRGTTPQRLLRITEPPRACRVASGQTSHSVAARIAPLAAGPPGPAATSLARLSRFCGRLVRLPQLLQLVTQIEARAQRAFDRHAATAIDKHDRRALRPRDRLKRVIRV